MKRIILTLIMLMLTLQLSVYLPQQSTAQNYTQARTLVCGKSISGTVLSGGVSYVPLRNFAESLGLSVEWNAVNATAHIRGNGIALDIPRSARYIVSGDRYIYLPQGIIVRDGVMLVPARALSAAFSLDVEWDSSTKTVAFNGISRAPETNYDADAVYWLARIINAEAGGEPLEGKIAVGNVVLNRVNSSAYPNTIYGVIFDRKYGVQFEPVINGHIYRTPSAESVAAAKLCLSGANTAGGSLFFLNPDKANNSWFVQNLTYVTRIGGHVFYI